MRIVKVNGILLSFNSLSLIFLSNSASLKRLSVNIWERSGDPRPYDNDDGRTDRSIRGSSVQPLQPAADDAAGGTDR